KKGEIEYTDDNGRYIEYDHSGKVLAEGPKSGTRNVGHWRQFASDGTLSAEGDYANGRKDGVWKYYYPSGRVSSEGSYENDLPVGTWTYYFEDGKLSSKGEFVGGKKHGYWSSLNQNGTLRSETDFRNGSGEYREYYQSGKLKIKGMIEDGKNQGKWTYYFEDGKIEGDCDFEKGKGTYRGYYPNGSLQTKGVIEDDLRVGTWELYDEDGTLTGYYKPFYEDNTLAGEINSLLSKPSTPVVTVNKSAKKGFYYFNERFPEYRGVILQGNPFAAFIGTFPMAIEFYNQERLGHEFEFDGIRDPFFAADSEVAQDQIFQRGYAIAVKQKFYNPLKTGMWYFAHEVRFTNVGHFANMNLAQQQVALITASASEQRAEYGILLGTRLMQHNDGNGFTIDAYVGYGIGYRSFDVEPIFEDVFRNLDQDKFAQTFRFGVNFGYSFSFDGRR
ncbi:MAG TPA: toxin-antitoxin system YwqK family antitoxin, partial [Cyclobacteriaceae bacterium]|nr:toxin-antitoxin system YwqK family antitoxin [Cyclobacteriaceae bacterium]